MPKHNRPPVRLLSADSLGQSRLCRREFTDAERKLWLLLHDRRFEGAKFRREHPIGPFSADFCCIKAKLVIEIDGGQHADNPYDARRTEYMQKLGFCLIRFWNHEVLKETESVLDRIREALGGGATEPSP